MDSDESANLTERFMGVKSIGGVHDGKKVRGNMVVKAE
jgi:hypothetical protein